MHAKAFSNVAQTQLLGGHNAVDCQAGAIRFSNIECDCVHVLHLYLAQMKGRYLYLD